jgi:aspartate aminotransferase
MFLNIALGQASYRVYTFGLLISWSFLMSFIADRMHSFAPSASLQVAAKARELKAQGLDIISLSTGEPDFDTPDFIKAAAIKAINDGDTKYTPADGTVALKDAIIAKFKRDSDLTYTHDQVIASAGAKHSLFNLFMATLNTGDEVVIPAPYWVSYPDMAKICGAVPVIIETTLDQDLKITPEQLEAAITSKTKLFVLNTPSNPSGMVYSRAELAALGEALLKHPHVLIASDDIYEHIRWNDEPFYNIVMACPKLFDRTIVVNGASKAYAMTGWRLGYAAGPKDVIANMKKLQSQSTSNPCSISQAAMAAALNGPQECLVPMVKAFEARHNYFVAELNKLPGVTCKNAQGAFYAFAHIQDAADALGLKDDMAFCTHMIEKALIAAVPGSAFGAPGFVRFSFATSMNNLEESIVRLQKLLGT